VKLSIRQLNLQLTHSWAIARSPATGVFKVVVVELDEAGMIGLGEAAPVSRYHESVESVQIFCRRVDASKLSFADVPGSMKYLDAIAPENMSAKCAINIALHDGSARLANKPLYDYLGLGFRDRHHVTSFTIGMDTPEVIRKKVAEAERFPVLKIKVGTAGDRESLKAVRDVAPTKWIRVDANEGWNTKEHALEMIEWLAQDKFVQYIEQPLPASTLEKDWTWLKRRAPLPIFGDESYHTAADAPRCAECFHGVNVKLVKTGGINGGLDALSAARKLGLKTMMGCMIETSILISAAAHLAELCDYLDVDGNLLIRNDPYVGVTAEQGILSFAAAPDEFGLRVRRKA
jgi:L-Ala-D/L-Glu epimerase